ncbi:unnamed protein product [Urochloa humidicola]
MGYQRHGSRAKVVEVCLFGSDVAAPQLQDAEGSSRTRSRRWQDIPEKIKKLLFEGEVGMTRRLDYNDVHSGAQSFAPTIPAQDFPTPQKSFSIPLVHIILQTVMKL